MENGRAKLELPNCTELVTVGPFSYFSDEQIQGIGKKKKKVFRMLKFAFEKIFFFLFPEIFWVLRYPHLLAKVRHQQASGTVHLATYSVATDLQHWWLVLRGKFTPEFTMF